MTNEDKILQAFHEGRLARRNAELGARLAVRKSFTEMVEELRNAKGLYRTAARREFSEIPATNV